MPHGVSDAAFFTGGLVHLTTTTENNYSGTKLFPLFQRS